MKRVLFVDDEAKVLDGLRRMLRSYREEWSMEFASSGRDALTLMNAQPYDVLVTDVRMPEMDGAQLLAEVRTHFPKTVRIVLTGECGRDAILRLLALAHRHLAKPCDAETLKSAVTRTCALQELLTNPSILALVSRLDSVPSVPTLYAEVIRELESNDTSLQKVGQIVAKDAGMTAKIMQVVQSAFFGLAGRASNPSQAVALLGSETTKLLVLAANIFTEIDPGVLAVLSIDSIWQQGQRSSKLAGLICQSQTSDPCVAQFATMAGMLQDVGRLILAAHSTTQYAEAMRLCGTGLCLSAAERIIFGASHADVGAYLLGLWGLPNPIVEVVAWHHSPNLCPDISFGPLTAVYLANGLLQEAGETPQAELAGLDVAYLERLGVSGRVNEWRRLAQDVQC